MADLPWTQADPWYIPSDNLIIPAQGTYHAYNFSWSFDNDGFLTANYLPWAQAEFDNKPLFFTQMAAQADASWGPNGGIVRAGLTVMFAYGLPPLPNGCAYNREFGFVGGAVTTSNGRTSGLAGWGDPMAFSNAQKAFATDAVEAKNQLAIFNAGGAISPTYAGFFAQLRNYGHPRGKVTMVEVRDQIRQWQKDGAPNALDKVAVIVSDVIAVVLIAEVAATAYTAATGGASGGGGLTTSSLEKTAASTAVQEVAKSGTSTAATVAPVVTDTVTSPTLLQQFTAATGLTATEAGGYALTAAQTLQKMSQDKAAKDAAAAQATAQQAAAAKAQAVAAAAAQAQSANASPLTSINPGIIVAAVGAAAFFFLS